MEETINDSLLLKVDSLIIPSAEYSQKKRPFGKLRIKLEENKKVVAAVLAFPLPFGFFGAHRIYLGTKPYIPFVYVGTLGGCAFILPLVDFFTIVFADEESLKRYENNSRIFMWAK